MPIADIAGSVVLGAGSRSPLRGIAPDAGGNPGGALVPTRSDVPSGAYPPPPVEPRRVARAVATAEVRRDETIHSRGGFVFARRQPDEAPQPICRIFVSRQFVGELKEERTVPCRSSQQRAVALDELPQSGAVSKAPSCLPHLMRGVPVHGCHPIACPTLVVAPRLVPLPHALQLVLRNLHPLPQASRVRETTAIVDAGDCPYWGGAHRSRTRGCLPRRA